MFLLIWLFQTQVDLTCADLYPGSERRYFPPETILFIQENVFHFQHWCNNITSAGVPQVQSGVIKLGSVGATVFQIKRFLPDGTKRGTQGEKVSINSTQEQTHFISKWLHFSNEITDAGKLPVKSWYWVHFSKRILIAAVFRLIDYQ